MKRNVWYTNYCEVCHIKPVNGFSDESLVSEINDINNLVALCPNHHWEFDHGLLQLMGRSINGKSVPLHDTTVGPIPTRPKGSC